MKQPNKLPKEIVDLLLPRLSDEFTAYYAYRAASNWCANVGYFKAAEYFKKESDDELVHAKNIEDFLVQWNIIPNLPTIKEPKTSFGSLVDVIDLAYGLEFDLYEAYEETSAKVFKTGDLCVFDFLQQYRTIQSQSVGEYSDMLNILQGCNTGDKFQMLLLEKKLFD